MGDYKTTFIDNLYRTRELKKMRNDINIYFDNIECSSGWYNHILNEKSTKKIEEINLKLTRIIKYIKQTWLSSSVSYKSQVQWIQWDIDIFQNIWNSYTYQFNKDLYFSIIDKAIWVYKDDFIYSIMRTINPLFWLNKIIWFIVFIPFYILWFSWFNLSKKSFENSIITKISKLFMLIISFIVWVIKILNFLEIDIETIRNLI